MAKFNIKKIFLGIVLIILALFSAVTAFYILEVKPKMEARKKSGTAKTVSIKGSTDKKVNGKVWDMYSDIPSGIPAYTFTIYTSQCGSATEEGDCYAREHLMANSYWGGIDDAANPQYSDLHHLFPADQ